MAEEASEGQTGSSEQTPGSPWTLAARGQAPSPARSSFGGGSSIASIAHRRAGSNPATRRPLGVGIGTTRAAVESTAISAKVDTLEAKLRGDLAKAVQHSDQLRDAAHSRIDSKLASLEVLQRKLERSLAETSGSNRALSDEVQTQIVRIDQIDTRTRDWRHQLEEEFRAKFAELEMQFTRFSSSVRSSSSANEDVVKRCTQRISQLESLVAERVEHHETTRQDVDTLHERLSDLEERHLEREREAQGALAVHISNGGLERWHGESNGEGRSPQHSDRARLDDACAKIENLLEDSHDLHMKLEAQEERLKTLRTRLETADTTHRRLIDHVEGTDWSGRFKDMQNQVLESNKQHLASQEHLEVLHRRVEQGERAHSELGESVSGLRVHVHTALGVSERSESEPDPALALELREWQARLGEVEAHMRRIEAAGSSVSLTTNGWATPHERLVEQVEAVLPEARRCIRQQEDVEERLTGLTTELDALRSKIAAVDTQVQVRASPSATDGEHHERLARVTGQQQCLVDQAQSAGRRIDELRERLDAVVGEVEQVRADERAFQQLAKLVPVLQDLAPKVIEQQTRLTALEERCPQKV